MVRILKELVTISWEQNTKSVHTAITEWIEMPMSARSAVAQLIAEDIVAETVVRAYQPMRHTVALAADQLLRPHDRP